MNMNKLYALIVLVTTAACTPGEIPLQDVVEKQGIAYHKDSETPFTGSATAYWPNGQFHKRVNYQDGKKYGLIEEFDENGQMRRKANYVDGKEDGLVEEFDEKGQIQQRLNYTDGKEDGLLEEYDKHGELRKDRRIQYKNSYLAVVELFKPDGDPDHTLTFKNGEIYQIEKYHGEILAGRTTYEHGSRVFYQRYNWRDGSFVRETDMRSSMPRWDPLKYNKFPEFVRELINPNK